MLIEVSRDSRASIVLDASLGLEPFSNAIRSVRDAVRTQSMASFDKVRRTCVAGA
jgi:hypothetical protein